MKILELSAENVKRIVAVKIAPNGNLVELTGRNGAGKTSILDSIQWAIEGAKHIQSKPIRKGAKEARIRLDLGDVIVTRKFWTKDDGSPGTSVVVEGADGAKFPSPQRMLDSFLGALSFDPLHFSRLPAKDQFEALRRFVPGVDFEGIDLANKKDFDARTDWNRRAKEARSTAAAIGVPDGTPEQEIDDAALVAELEKAGQRNAEIEREKASRARIAQEATSKQANAADARKQAAELRSKADAADELAMRLESEAKGIEQQIASMAPIPAAIDTAVVREKIAKAKAINEAVARRKQHAEAIDKAHKAEAEAQQLTQRMEARSKEKLAAIAAAKLPVEGLGFGEGEVLLNGIPFDQASDAEQLRASIVIAMAGDPKLRVIRVRDGSLLDADGMRILAEMADEHDMQVWIERVSSDGKVGFVIEEGKVAGAEELVAASVGSDEDEEVCW